MNLLNVVGFNDVGDFPITSVIKRTGDMGKTVIFPGTQGPWVKTVIFPGTMCCFGKSRPIIYQVY